MNYGSTNTKPGAGTPGFAQSTWTLFAFLSYRIRNAGANACLPFLLIAFDGARSGAALFWGTAS